MFVIFFVSWLFSCGNYNKGLKIVISRKHNSDHVTPLLRILPSLPIAVESSPTSLSRLTRPSVSWLCLPLCPPLAPALHPCAVPVMHSPTPGPSWIPAHAVLSAGTRLFRASQTPTQRWGTSKMPLSFNSLCGPVSSSYSQTLSAHFESSIQVPTALLTVLVLWPTLPMRLCLRNPAHCVFLTLSTVPAAPLWRHPWRFAKRMNEWVSECLPSGQCRKGEFWVSHSSGSLQGGGGWVTVVVFSKSLKLYRGKAQGNSLGWGRWHLAEQ